MISEEPKKVAEKSILMYRMPVIIIPVVVGCTNVVFSVTFIHSKGSHNWNCSCIVNEHYLMYLCMILSFVCAIVCTCNSFMKSSSSGGDCVVAYQIEPLLKDSLN